MTFRGRPVDCVVLAQLVPDSVETDDRGRTLATIAVSARFKKPVAGKFAHVVAFRLGEKKGPPTTLLKSALVELEESTGMRLEMFEVVDVTRQFLGFAVKLGYKVKGFGE